MYHGWRYHSSAAVLPRLRQLSGFPSRRAFSIGMARLGVRVASRTTHDKLVRIFAALAGLRRSAHDLQRLVFLILPAEGVIDSMLRSAVVAGQFYPGQKESLLQTVDSLISSTAAEQPAIALMSPHAGYIYSGGVAGQHLFRCENS